MYHINLWKWVVFSDLHPSIVSLFVHSILVYRVQFQGATLGRSLKKVGQYDLVLIMELYPKKFPTSTLRNYKYPQLYCINVAVIYQEQHMALHRILWNLKDHICAVPAQNH